MDTYSEQLVKKQTGSTETLKKVLISVAAVLLASILMFLSMITGFMVFVLFAVGALAGGIWLMGRQNVEYEYIITNTDLDIDKIIGRSKRKRMISLDLSTAEEFAPYPPENDVKTDATVQASSGTEKDAYYLILSHSGYGKVKLIFNPNERTREAVMQGIPNSLRVKITHNVK